MIRSKPYIQYDRDNRYDAMAFCLIHKWFVTPNMVKCFDTSLCELMIFDIRKERSDNAY